MHPVIPQAMARMRGVEYMLPLLLLLCRARESQNLLMDMPRSCSSREPGAPDPGRGALNLRGGQSGSSTWENVSRWDDGLDARMQVRPTLRMCGGVRRISVNVLHAETRLSPPAGY
eukprot:751317-Hanusia_phi.AAC.4